MKLNFITKPCPACKTSIKIGLFSYSEEILRCPNCKELLRESPKRILFGAIILFLGIFVGYASSISIGISSIWGLMVIILSSAVMLKVRTLTIVKKELVIKNKATNVVSYIDKSDWNEIIKNTSDKENSFEIIEELK